MPLIELITGYLVLTALGYAAGLALYEIYYRMFK